MESIPCDSASVMIGAIRGLSRKKSNKQIWFKHSSTMTLIKKILLFLQIAKISIS